MKRFGSCSQDCTQALHNHQPYYQMSAQVVSRGGMTNKKAKPNKHWASMPRGLPAAGQAVFVCSSLPCPGPGAGRLMEVI